MAPRSDRFLLEEISVHAAKEGISRRSISDAVPPSHAELQSASKQKMPKQNRRLSDMINASDKDRKKPPSVGSKRDIWLIRVSDVTIRCQRVGITTAPLGTPLQIDKQKGSARRALPAKKRNLYRFIDVERWEMRAQVGQGMVSMDDVVRMRELGGLVDTEDDDQFDQEAEMGTRRMSYVEQRGWLLG